MSYDLCVRLIREEEGGFSAIALNLPGVVGCGTTADEAIESIKAGFKLAVEVYEEDGKPIPWCDKNKFSSPPGQTQWIVV